LVHAPFDQRDAQCRQPAERLGDEHQQLALFVSRCLQPEARAISPLHGYVRGELSRRPRATAASAQQGMDARDASGGSL
jgi:hypothetical protein